MIKKGVLRAIKAYQMILSPDHSFWRWQRRPVCRFLPTCSQFTYEAIEKYGVFKGLGIGVKRILRCHPLNKGGFDPVS